MPAANAPKETHVLDLIPGYALESLNAVDMRLVTEHLAQCAHCRSELEAYREVVDALYLAVPEVEPPLDVKQQLMHRVAQVQPAVERRPVILPAIEPPAPAKPPAAAPKQETSRRSWRDWFSLRVMLPQPLALVGLVLIVLLAVGNVWQWQQNRMAAKNAEFRLFHLAGTENAPGASAVLVMNQEGTQGTLVAADLPLLDPAYQYQLWLIKDGQRTSGGVFSVNRGGYGSLPLYSHDSMLELSGFGVTIEPAGGSPGPTGKKVLGGEIQ